MNLDNYPKISKLLQLKQLIIHKIRGQDSIQNNTENSDSILFKRPYIEIIINSKLVQNIYSKLESTFILVVRNYKTKQLYDNLYLLKNIGLQKNDFIPKSIYNPFNVKFFKPKGQYGICLLYTSDAADE